MKESVHAVGHTASVVNTLIRTDGVLFTLLDDRLGHGTMNTLTLITCQNIHSWCCKQLFYIGRLLQLYTHSDWSAKEYTMYIHVHTYTCAHCMCTCTCRHQSKRKSLFFCLHSWCKSSIFHPATWQTHYSLRTIVTYTYTRLSCWTLWQ